MPENCIQEVSVIISQEPGNKIVLKSVTPKNGTHINGCRTLKLPIKKQNEETEDCITLSYLISRKIELQSITSLSLTLCNLSCLPPALCALESLRCLNVSHNKLTEVPKCLEQGLCLLEQLDLSFNYISHFEAEPKCYKKLKALRINNNLMIDIPEWILYVRCFNLEELIYSFNCVNWLKACRYHTSVSYRLRKLEMMNCYVLHQDSKFINKIRTLQELNLSNDKSKKNCNSLRNGDELFENHNWAHSLQVLKLNSLYLSIVSEKIISLINLRILELRDNNLMWLPDSITGLINLEELDVSHNCITYLPSDLHILKKIKTLKVQYNQLCRLPDMNGMCNLQYFDLYENLLEDCKFDMCSVECIDLEMNYVDTSQLSDLLEYPKRKLRLREKVTELRHEQKKEMSPCIQDTESSTESSVGSTSCEEDDDDNIFTQNYPTKAEEEERWDEENTVVNENYVRVCSLSDEEWEGFEKITVEDKNTADVPRQYSFLFVDAEE